MIGGFMKTLFILMLVILGGCVHARDPQIITIRQSGDSTLTCEQIAAEYKSNTEQAQNKIAKNEADDHKELLLGILVWPGLIDLKNADGTEGNALLDRNIYLRGLAQGKSCAAVDSWPGQPERYTMFGYGAV
jgi:hypothetical protein